MKDEERSYWIDSAPIKLFPRLQKNMNVDVLVIGAGVTGISAAYLLKKAGLNVALIERERVASVDTGHTTAHLTYVTDVGLQELAGNFGNDHAQAAWDAGAAAIDEIERIVREEAIQCEFTRVPAYLHLCKRDFSQKEVSSLRKEDQSRCEAWVRCCLSGIAFRTLTCQARDLRTRQSFIRGNIFGHWS